MTRLKIAYLCDISPEHEGPYSGGNARIFRALSARADVHVLPQSWGMAEPIRRALYAMPDGAQLRLRWRVHLLLARLIAAPINRHLKTGGYDAVFAAYSFQSLSRVSPPADCLTVFTSDATPTVYRRSEIGRAFGTSWLNRTLVDPWVLRAEKRVFRALDVMLCPSDWLANEAAPLYGLRPDVAHVLPWGANVDDPGLAPPPPAPGKDSPLNLLIIARDWFAKGGPLAFETLEALRAHGIDARLTVIGCTPPEAHVNAHVTVLGPLDKSKPKDAATFNAALRAAHFLMQPSFESYGFAFCEAAAFGLPVLCHKIGGVPVRDGITGHTLPHGASAAEFAERIIDQIQSPTAYLEMCQAARADYENRLNWETWADNTVSLIKEELAQR